MSNDKKQQEELGSFDKDFNEERKKIESSGVDLTGKLKSWFKDNEDSPTPLSAEETPISKALKEFERLKAESNTLRDKIYLDGVLSVLQSILPYEKEYSAQQTAQLRQQVEESERRRENQFKTIEDFQDVCNKHFPGGNAIIYGSDLDKRLTALKERNEKMERDIEKICDAYYNKSTDLIDFAQAVEKILNLEQ